MSFRLEDAPAILQRAMDTKLSSVKVQLALVYLGDIVVFSKNAKQPHVASATSIGIALGCRSQPEAKDVVILCGED